MLFVDLLRTFKSKVAPNLVLNRTPLDAQIAALHRQINDLHQCTAALALTHEDAIDVLRRRNEMLAEQVDDLEQFKLTVWNDRHSTRTFHHHPRRLTGEAAAAAEGSAHASVELVTRIAMAYRRAVETPVGSSESIWLNEYATANKETHDILMADDFDAISDLLQEPTKSMLFFGFDSLSRDAINREPWWIASNHQLAYDGLLQLTRAIGVRRVENPESHIDFDETPGVEELLGQLDERFGFRVDFPNLFAGEAGVRTTRGVANIRSVYALYQAWRTAELVKGIDRPRVLEIGAGLGRSAYYASKFGISDYTIIDIPLTSVSQSFYLGVLLGEHAVSLWGEDASAQVRMLPPIAYETMDERFDLIVNVDSLTEMAHSTAANYLTGARRMTNKFLSINHEHNAFTVESIRASMAAKVWRTPCWIRRGYVDELISFTESESPK